DPPASWRPRNRVRPGYRGLTDTPAAPRSRPAGGTYRVVAHPPGARPVAMTRTWSAAVPGAMRKKLAILATLATLPPQEDEKRHRENSGDPEKRPQTSPYARCGSVVSDMMWTFGRSSQPIRRQNFFPSSLSALTKM